MKSEVIIIGGGIVGIILACSLAQENIDTILIEQKNIKDIKFNILDGRTSAITHRSKLFFEKYNLWQEIEQYTNPIDIIKIIESNSNAHIEFDKKFVEDKTLGYMIENQSILKSLYNFAEQLDKLKIIESDYLSIDRDIYGVEVKLEKSQIYGNILIAADGKFSKIRKTSNIKIKKHKFNQTAIICNVSHDINHNNIAYEKFSPQGPFAILPLLGGTTSSIVWVERSELAKLYLKMSNTEITDHLSLKFGKELGKIEIISKIFSYKLSSHTAEKYYDTRLALIGDAAHSIHPIAGQGLNLGIMDIEIILHLIKEAKFYGFDIGSNYLLSNYENLRISDNENMRHITTILNSIFTNKSVLINIIKKLGLDLIESKPYIKALFMKYAMGLR